MFARLSQKKKKKKQKQKLVTVVLKVIYKYFLP